MYYLMQCFILLFHSSLYVQIKILLSYLFIFGLFNDASIASII
jgi:hypothetical protein